MQKYRTNNYSFSIEQVECTRETESTVFFMKYNKERRELKEGISWKYHDSEEAAIKYLIDYQTEKVIQDEKSLEWRNGELSKLIEKYNQE